jgi:dihydropteroate synthase
MQDDPRYEDVGLDIFDWLEARMGACVAAGIAPERIFLDPGIGFGKTPDQNLELVRRLDRIVAIGRPVLVGLSRKSTLARVLDGPDTRVGTDAASVGAAVAAFDRGASLFRVHEVRSHVEALAAAAAVERGTVRA